MGIGDDQLDPGQTAAFQHPQEFEPEGFRLRGADLHTQHLAPAIGVDGHGDTDRDGDDAPVLPAFDIGSVDPEIRPIALDRPLQEGLHPVVDLLAEPAHLALGDAGHAHRLDQIVDGARGDALDVGLLDHRGQGLLGHPAGLQKAGEVAALAHLGDAQLHGPGPRLPIAIAVAVALNQPLGRTLAVRGAGQSLDLQFHQPMRGKADHLAQKVGISPLLKHRTKRHHLVGHRGHPRLSFVVVTRLYRRPTMAAPGRNS